MYLENNILSLRAPEPEDLEKLYLWENMSELWETGNTRQPYSRYALKKYISEISNDIYESGQLRLMMVEKTGGQTVGTVDLFDFDMHHSRVAFGLFVDPAFSGRGFAKTALHLLETYVFDFLKINQLYCHISTSNKASMSMFEKENFSKTILRNWIKTKNEYDDVAVFQQMNAEYKLKQP